MQSFYPITTGKSMMCRIIVLAQHHSYGLANNIFKFCTPRTCSTSLDLRNNDINKGINSGLHTSSSAVLKFWGIALSECIPIAPTEDLKFSIVSKLLCVKCIQHTIINHKSTFSIDIGASKEFQLKRARGLRCVRPFAF